MPQTLNVGIVGYGYASATFHAPLIAGVQGLKLAAVASRHPAKVRRDWPGVDVESSPEDLFARRDLQLIVIPTPAMKIVHVITEIVKTRC